MFRAYENKTCLYAFQWIRQAENVQAVVKAAHELISTLLGLPYTHVLPTSQLASLHFHRVLSS